MKGEKRTKKELVEELEKLSREVSNLREENLRLKHPQGQLFSEWNCSDSFMHSMPGVIMLLDERVNLIWWNRNLEDVAAYSSEDISKMNFLDFFPEEENELAAGKVQKIFQQGKCSVELALVSKDKERKPYFFKGIRMLEDGREYAVLMGVNIADRKKLEERLREASMNDELTGLLNRRGFFTIAQKQCEISSRKNFNLYFIYIDLDGLKSINDRFGHKTGDLALVDAANILRESFRASDVIARIGGDEFVVMAMETPETDIDLLTRRLRENLDAHNRALNESYGLDLSLGITLFNPDNPCSVDELISRADRLMYEDKRQKNA